MADTQTPRNLAARAGRWSAHNRKKAILGWLAFVIIAVFIGGSVGTKVLDDGDLGIGESGRADEAVAAHIPDKANESVLVQAQNGARANDPQLRGVVDSVVAKLEATKHVKDVQSPYARGNQGQLSEDGGSALVTFEIPGENAEDKVDPALATVGKLDKQHAGYRIEEFGSASADKALSQAFEDDFKRAEVTSLPITLIILILAFGALLAAFVPLVLAITAVAAAIGLIGPISQIWPVDESINSVVLLIGLAVGVDYALFYIRREREERAAGRSEEAALEAAAATSGRAVLVSGFTVIGAMAGMYLGGAATFASFATGTILVVSIAVLGSLTVLPAVLSKLGDRVNKGRVPFMKPEKRTGEPRVWSWILDRVLKRPLVSAIAAASVLIVLAIPVFHIHTANTGIEGLPRSIEAVKTYDRMQAVFPGEQFTADVVVEGSGLDEEQIHGYAQELRALAGSSDQYNEPVTVDMSPDGQVAQIHVPLAGTGTDDTSMDAVESLRSDVLPGMFADVRGGELVGVTGITAGSVDFNELMSERIWYVLAFVFAMAFVLLLVTFRSIVIPIKAIALNLLSVGAALGVVVWVFQDGNFENLLNFDSSGSVSAWFPLMLFVILFGLSMDYHVFILSRIKEAVDRGESTDDAVAHGIKSTAGVVTAAAIVMVAVFGIFATLQFVDMKQFGVGLAVAVLLDATLVRGVLLPSTMKLLGDWNWYLPRWLEWIPRGPALEGAPEPVAQAPERPRRPVATHEPQPAEG